MVELTGGEGGIQRLGKHLTVRNNTAVLKYGA